MARVFYDISCTFWWLVKQFSPALVFVLGTLTACSRRSDGENPALLTWSATEKGQILKLSPLGKAPRDTSNRVAEDPRAVELGKRLFFEKRLSANGTVSCATCHDPTLGWGDGKAVSTGLEQVTKNAPTLWNVAYQRWFFWDGRADSLWAQAIGPLENPKEMGGNRLSLLHFLSKEPDFKAAYEDLFGPLPDTSDETRFPQVAKPDGPGEQTPAGTAWLQMQGADAHAANAVLVNAVKAIAAFERTIVTAPSPFDGFVTLAKETSFEDALTQSSGFSEAAARGLKLFLGKGKCVLCHTGPNFTDREFHNLGLPLPAGMALDFGRYAGIGILRGDPFNALGSYGDDATVVENSLTRFAVAREEQKGQFKTPTLRNVAKTAPYMHDGQFATLREVVDFYSDLPGLPVTGHREDFLQPLLLSQEEKDDLIAFLESLTGIGD